MSDPKDEQTIMQRFNRLLRAMVQGAPSGKTPAPKIPAGACNFSGSFNKG
jgi:hypothetical protein